MAMKDLANLEIILVVVMSCLQRRIVELLTYLRRISVDPDTTTDDDKNRAER